MSKKKMVLIEVTYYDRNDTRRVRHLFCKGGRVVRQVYGYKRYAKLKKEKV